MNTNSLNKLSAEIHQGNVSRGFYDEKHEVGTYLALITSELSEALEADRKGRHADLKKFDELKGVKEYADAFKETIKDTFEDEIADTFIRLFDIVGYYGIDIERHIEAKLHYNSTRGYKHGKKY